LAKKNIKESERETKDNTPCFKWILSGLIVLLLVLIILGCGIYRFGWQNYFTSFISRVIPYPAAVVNYTGWVSLSEYNENSRAMRQFLEAKEAAEGEGAFDFGTPEGVRKLAVVKKNVLEQLIESKIIKKLAEDRGIEASKQEIDRITKFVLSQSNNGSGGFTELDYFYGWSEDDFKDKVIENVIYKEKLEKHVREEGELDHTAKSKLREISGKINGGANFEDLAREYSEAPSNQEGGLLPTFERQEVPEEFADAAFKLNAGDVSEPVEVEEGWHYILLEKKIREGGKDKAQVRHILVRRRTFGSWLEEQKKNFSVLVPIHTYFWHYQMGKLYFKDDELNQIEDNWRREYLEDRTQTANLLLKFSNEKNE